jgi:hypothetical protein
MMHREPLYLVHLDLKLSLAYAAAFTKMAKCHACQEDLQRPPTIELLQHDYPALSYINYHINRNLHRCLYCDLLVANQAELEAKYPPPDNTDVVKALEQQIHDARDLIEDGIRKDELEAALPRMYWKLAKTVQRIHDIKVAAWEEYRGIWGYRNGR